MKTPRERKVSIGMTRLKIAEHLERESKLNGLEEGYHKPIPTKRTAPRTSDAGCGFILSGIRTHYSPWTIPKFFSHTKSQQQN